MSKIKPSKGAPYARILGVGGYRPTRVVPNEVILEKIDSSDEWIRSRSGIATRHWASPEENRRRDVGGGLREGHRGRRDPPGADRRRGRLHGVALPPDPGDRHGDRGPHRGGQARRVRHLRRLRGLRLRPDPRQGHDRRGFRGVRARHRRRAVERPDGSGGPRDGLPVRRRRRRRGRRSVGRAAHRPHGLGFRGRQGDDDQADRAVGRVPRWRRLEPAARLAGRDQVPAITQEGQAVFRWAVFEMAKVASRPWTPPASRRTTWTSSSRTRRTCGSSTRW